MVCAFPYIYFLMLYVELVLIDILVCGFVFEAKRQRTIQVMDIHEIPKPRNAFVKNKGGGGGSHSRHW